MKKSHDECPNKSHNREVEQVNNHFHVEKIKSKDMTEQESPQFSPVRSPMMNRSRTSRSNTPDPNNPNLGDVFLHSHNPIHIDPKTKRKYQIDEEGNVKEGREIDIGASLIVEEQMKVNGVADGLDEPSSPQFSVSSKKSGPVRKNSNISQEGMKNRAKHSSFSASNKMGPKYVRDSMDDGRHPDKAVFHIHGEDYVHYHDYQKHPHSSNPVDHGNITFSEGHTSAPAFGELKGDPAP